MANFKSLVLFAATALATITLRDPPALIMSDLVALDNSVNTLRTSIDSYTGGLISATLVLLAGAGVHLTNRKCYYDAMAIPNQNAPDSYTIIKYVNDTLCEDIPNSVTALEEKYDLVEKDGLTAEFKSALELLKSDHDTFSAVLKGKASQDPQIQAFATYVVKVIDDSLAKAIVIFSS